MNTMTTRKNSTLTVLADIWAQGSILRPTMQEHRDAGGYGNLPHPFEQAKTKHQNYRGLKSHVPIANNTWIHQDSEGNHHIRYHNTDIMSFSPNGDVTVNADGWASSPSTAQRLNAFLPDGAQIRSDGARRTRANPGGARKWLHLHGETEEYHDGVSFNHHTGEMLPDNHVRPSGETVMPPNARGQGNTRTPRPRPSGGWRDPSTGRPYGHGDGYVPPSAEGEDIQYDRNAPRRPTLRPAGPARPAFRELLRDNDEYGPEERSTFSAPRSPRRHPDTGRAPGEDYDREADRRENQSADRSRGWDTSSYDQMTSTPGRGSYGDDMPREGEDFDTWLGRTTTPPPTQCRTCRGKGYVRTGREMNKTDCTNCGGAGTRVPPPASEPDRHGARVIHPAGARVFVHHFMGPDRDENDQPGDWATVLHPPGEHEYSDRASEHLMRPERRGGTDFFQHFGSRRTSTRHSQDDLEALSSRYLAGLRRLAKDYSDSRIDPADKLCADHADLNAGHPVQKSNKEDCHACKYPTWRRLAMNKNAFGETVAPVDVDTLRDEECPVCGESSSSFDGKTCEVCGFDAPPVMFRDPDLEKARSLDLRKDVMEGGNALPGQDGLTPGQQDANGGLPGEIPGNAVPGSDQVPMDPSMLGPDGQSLPGADDQMQMQQVDPAAIVQQQMEQLQSGVPLTPDMLGPDGSVGQGGDPMAQGGEMGMMDPNGNPIDPGGLNPDGSTMDPAMSPGLPPTPLADPNAPALLGGDTSLAPNNLGPEGQFGENGPEGPRGPGDESVDPGALDPQGNPVAPDGQEYTENPAEGDPGTPADGTADLICPACGFSADAQQPTSVDMDTQAVGPAGAGDGTMAGDVCPNCGGATMVSTGEMEQMDQQMQQAPPAQTPPQAPPVQASLRKLQTKPKYRVMLGIGGLQVNRHMVSTSLGVRAPYTALCGAACYHEGDINAMTRPWGVDRESHPRHQDCRSCAEQILEEGRMMSPLGKDE